MKKNMWKRCLAAVLSLLLLVTALPMTAWATYDSFMGDDYYLKLMSPDMQAFQGSENLEWGGSRNLNWYYDQTTTYLAKNEKEGFQVFFYEKGDGRDIRLEIGEYVNANGDVLPHAVFKEIYFGGMVGVSGKMFAEPLVPYNGESIHVNNGESTVFYVELQSETDQPAGAYTSHFTIYDGDEIVRTSEITAEVWNFALPEAHYSSTIMGLYNASSGYGATDGFLKKSGIHFNGSAVIPEDIPEAERILEGWQDFLLDHGVTTYEIPRFLMDLDAKAAELRLADPRRHAFTVPQYAGRYDAISSDGLALIRTYKDLCYDNPFLKDKAVFYAGDETNFNKTDEVEALDTRLAQIKSIWPDAHVVISTMSVGESNIQALKSRSDVLCVNQALNRVDQTYYDTLTDSDWYRTWRYSSNDFSGCFATSVYGKTPMGNYIKVFYWQQEALDSDGMLNWNCAYLPDVNNEPYDVWASNELQSVAGVNGEGIFVYESNSLGLDPATPIASIRLKHINDGMDDYDYLQLAKERFGTGADSPYTRAMNTALCYFTSKGPKYVFSSEKSMWPDGGNYEFNGHDNERFYNARILLGNALSEAGGVTHDFGAWENAVEPDATHDGLQIRTCAECGTQESRSMQAHEHVFGDWEITAQPTCTADGQKARTCSVCGGAETEPIPAFGHDWSEAWTYFDAEHHAKDCANNCGERLTEAHDWVLDEEESYYPTEESEGLNVYDCTVCGGHKEEVIPPYDHPHNFEAVITEPTCTEGGYTTYTCPYCGESFVGDETDPLGHLLDDGVVTKEANCVEDGEITYTCARCGETVTEPIPSDPTAHRFDYSVVTPATCTEDGYTTYTCIYCGEMRTLDNDDDPALGHDWDNGVATKEATCVEDGEITYTCARCGETFTETVPSDPTAHRFDYSVVTPATCTEDGYTTYTCIYCGEMRTLDNDDDPALGHDWNGEWEYNDEDSHVKYCLRCNEPMYENHEWLLNVEESFDATEIEDGMNVFYCAYCFEQNIEIIPQLGHTHVWDEGVETLPTCTNNGYITYTCYMCGETTMYLMGSALGHDWILDEENSYYPTEESEGLNVYFCSRCGEHYEEVIPPYDHPHYFDAVITEPTCTAGGYTTYTCPYCLETFVGDETDPLGHDWSEWVVTTPATTEAEGVETSTCSRCGETQTRPIPPLPVTAKFVVTGGKAKAGETVQVTVSAEENPGVTAAMLHLTYDPQVLTLTAVDNGAVFADEYFQAGGDLTAVPFTVFWIDALAEANYTSDGTVVTFTFTVANNAPIGTTPVTVTVDEDSTFDKDLQNVPFGTQAGAVEVAPRIPGDADGDGNVSLLDVASLLRYLAGGWGETVDASNADVNGDGKLDLRDVTILRRYLAGWDVELV